MSFVLLVVVLWLVPCFLFSFVLFPHLFSCVSVVFLRAWRASLRFECTSPYDTWLDAIEMVVFIRVRNENYFSVMFVPMALFLDEWDGCQVSIKQMV